MGAKEMKAVVLDNPAHARQKMIIASTVCSHNSWQQHQRLEIGAKGPESRPHQRADKDHVAAAGGTSVPGESAQLANTNPMVRIACDHWRVGVAAKCEKHDRPSAL
jgi:hypothetical protein